MNACDYTVSAAGCLLAPQAWLRRFLEGRARQSRMSEQIDRRSTPAEFVVDAHAPDSSIVPETVISCKSACVSTAPALRSLPSHRCATEARTSLVLGAPAVGSLAALAACCSCSAPSGRCSTTVSTAVASVRASCPRIGGKGSALHRGQVR
eukprot:scaffold168907_cov31-Tisochrysis_lutea.AAC.3